jgi:transposase
MIPKAALVRLTPVDRSVLEARVRAPTTEQRDVLRARIVLLAGAGGSTRSIAKAVKVTPRTVSLCRGCFAREGRSGLAEKPRPGPPAKYGAETGRRVLALLDRPPPAGFVRWTGPLIAAELGDVHIQHVWRVLRAQKLNLTASKSGCERCCQANDKRSPLLV